MAGDHPTHTGDVTITMTSGTVEAIYVGHSYGGHMRGNVTIAVSGTATCEILPSSFSVPPGYGDVVTGKMRLYVTSENVTIGKNLGTPIDGLVQKSASGWNISGDAVVPSGCTMEIAGGETVTVSSGAKLTNNGIIINNGVIKLPQSASQFAGSIPIGTGVFKVNLPCLEVESAEVDTVMVNGMEVTDPVYTLLAGKMYLDVPRGKIYAKINGSDYCCEFVGEAVELTPYACITSVTVTPATVTAGTSTELSATVQPLTALEQTVAYEIVDAGTTEATVSGSTLTTPYSGTVKLRATATDGYYAFSEDVSITVEYVPVTGIAGDSVIPHEQTVELTSIVLPAEVEPANAGYRTIEWSANGPAVVSGGTLKLLDQGTVTLTATVKNGLGKGQDFVKNYTLTATNPAALDVSQGDITIEQDKDVSGKLLVRYGAGSESVAYYNVNDLITITGQTETYQIFVSSGSPKLLLNNCKITASGGSAIVSFSSNSSMEIILTGTNVLSGGENGINLVTGQTLTIDGTGSLNASGGTMAAIGPSRNGTCGTITINGGTITASTQVDSLLKHAAIGGKGSSGVVINGGTVIANGGTYAAGIGPNVTIYGGDVTATGGDKAAGIGGDFNISSTVTIYGGTVKGTSTGSGAGIGGGYDESGTVIIYGGTVKGTSTGSGAGIGGGSKGDGTVTIHDGTVEGSTSDLGAGIGGGYSGDGTVTIFGGSVSATGGKEAAGIGGGKSGSGTVTISGGSVSATGGEKAAGIGGGDNSGGNGTVTISGGSVTATGGEEGTGIGGGYHGDGTVTISGGSVTANSGVKGFIAVGEGYAGSDSTVIITGGSLKANQRVIATNGEANGSQSVSLKELTIEDLDSEAKIASAAGLPGYYGLNDVQTIDKKLYFYLPGDYPTSVTAGGETYFHAGSGLYIDHMHSWNYAVNTSGDTITATCTAADCPNNNGGSVSLSGPQNTQIHTGSEIKPVTIFYSTDWMGSRELAVSYTNNTALGEATALLSLGDASVSVKFDIVAEIRFDAASNGGSCDKASILTDKGGKLTANLPANVTHESLFFTGWYDAQTGGNKIEDDHTFTGSTTLYAQFADHQHSWTYSDETSGDPSITATCAGCLANGNNDLMVTITLEAPDKTIYGDGQSAEATVTQNPAESIANLPAVVYSGRNNTQYALSPIAPTDAGDYTVSFTMGEGDNTATAQVEYTINPLTITADTVTVGAFDLEYDGTAQTPNAIVTMGTLTVTGTWSNVTNVTDTTTFTANGNFTGTLSNYPTDMKKATPKINPVPAAVNPVYNGTAQALITAGVVNGGELQYSLDGQSWNTEIPTATEVNTYTVWYKVVGNENFNDVAAASISAAISVSGTDMTATAQEIYVYGEEITINVSGIEPTGEEPTASFNLPRSIMPQADGDNTVAVYNGADQLTQPLAVPESGALSIELPMVLDVDNYTLTVKFSGNANMAAAEREVSFTVTQADGKATVTLEDWVYGNTANTPVAQSETNTGVTPTIEYKVRNAEDSTYTAIVPADVGEYTVRSTFAETQNYKAVTATDDFAITISGSTMTASLTNLPETGAYTYGETVTVLVSGVTPTKEAPAVLRMLTGAADTSNQIAIFNGGQQLTEYKTPAEDGVSFELTGLNAGTYNLTAQFTGNDNMAAASVPVPEFTINRATPTANVPTGVTAIYGQTLSQITLTNPEGNTPGVWSWMDGTASVGDAGEQTHNATFTPEDAANYETLNGIEVTITVSKADPTVTPPAALNPVYTGEALVLISTGSTNAGTMEYSLDGTNYSTDLPAAIHAASYTVYYRVNGTDNYNGADAASITASIVKATPVVTAPVPLDPAYIGSAQTLISAGSTTFGTLEYSLDGQNYSTELPTGTDAKAYTVYYRVPGSDNWYEAAAQSITAYIGQNTTVMTMTPAAQTVTYGADAAFTVTAQPATQQSSSLRSLIAPAKNQVAIFYGDTQLTEPQNVTGGELAFTVNTKEVGLYANANAYTLTAKYVGNDNMKDQTATAAVTVTKASGTGSVSITGWTYGMTANALVPATATNDVNAVTYLYTGTTNAGVPYSSAATPTEAGEYSVTATFAATTNYTEYTTVAAAFTIARKDDLSDVMPSNLTAIYGHTLSNVTLPQNWSWADGTDEVGGKGENKHKANYAGDANHNAKSNVELIVTVGQSESALTADSDKDAYTYGEIVTIEAVLAQPQQTFSHLRAFAPAASGQMAVYNGSTQLTAAQNAKYGETLTFTLDTEADGLTPGSYTLTVKFIESDNMAEASADVSFTVSWLDLTDIPDPTLPDGSTGSGEGQDGDSWYSGDVTITAPDGYEISTDGGETWGPTGTINTSGSPDGENTFDYLLQDTQTGEIGTGSITIQTDNTDPVVTTPTVNSTDTTATITVPATDAFSGIAGSTLTQTGGEPAVTITNNGNGTFSITGMTPGETYTFDLTVTDNAGNTTTITGITVTASAAVAIVWPTEDQIVTVYEGEQAKMSIVANNAFRYQWYINYNDGTGWHKKEGATSATHISSPTELDNSGYQYGCIAFGESGEVYAKSPIFTLEVLKVPVLPETGDNRPIGLWISLLALSLTGMLLMLRNGKRRYN